MEFESITVDNDSMSCIITPMETDHIMGITGEKSVILPLPSSPHWAPTTAVILDRLADMKCPRQDL